MESENIIVDPIHFINIENYMITKSIYQKQVQVVEEKDTHQLLYLVKKSENYNANTKISFIDYLEKSYKLIHPSIINLSGYSVQKPYLYYKYSQDPLNITDIKLTDENIQKIFIGIASGLSYLISKGYHFSNFSFNSIIFDEKCYPKIIDYIEYEKKGSEKDMIIKYADLIQNIIKDKINEDSSISINEELKGLINKCKQKNDAPSFDDFINFFMSKPFRNDFDCIHNESYQEYLEILQLSDKIIYDNCLSKNIENCESFNSIEQICYYFFNNKKTTLEKDEIFILNSLPEYYIKQLTKINPALSKKLIRYAYNEDISLIIPNWKKLCEKEKENPFKIYNKIMQHMKVLDEQSQQKNNIELKYKKESLIIHAIFFLKKATKQLNDPKIQIELAIQYIKGEILPYNITKALEILNKISNADQETQKLINQMKEKTSSTINSSSLELIIANAKKDKKKILQKAVNGDVFSLLYSAFSFYTGFNGFQILRSLAIQLYRDAASKSSDAMLLLGYFYFNGIIFPQNLTRAMNCFKRAADNGSLKAEIIDGILRKHRWRSYILDFDIDDLFKNILIEPSETLIFPKIVYSLENSISNNTNYELILKNMSKSSNDYDLHLNFYEKEKWNKKIKPVYSEKILLNNKNAEDVKVVKEQLFLAKSYFNGDNNYPVNYTKSAEFFKLAAIQGDSEAQWRYALMNINSIGDKYNFKTARNYLQKSAESNNLKGKFCYALFIKKYENDLTRFQKLIKECCKSEDLDSMYYYARYLEKDESTLDESIELYKKLVHKGHFDALIRLINILKKQPDKKYMEIYRNLNELSVGIFNETNYINLIKFYDNNKEYEKSNILIQFGLTLGVKIPNIQYYYLNSLLFHKGAYGNIRKAKKLIMSKFKTDKKYIYLMLQLFVSNNEHEKALRLLLNAKYNNQIDEEHRDEFLEFYKKFDQRLASKYSIPSYFYYKDFRKCHSLIMNFNLKIENSISVFSQLTKLAKDDNNPFALAFVGKIYKQGKLVIRDLRTAIKYFACSCKHNCPLGYYYLGKEYFYGRYLKTNYDKAKQFLLKSFANNVQPRAGYYLYKISEYQNKKKISFFDIGLDEYLEYNGNIKKKDETFVKIITKKFLGFNNNSERNENKLKSNENNSSDDIKMLKVGVEFGHKRAIYKYGRLLYKEDNEKNKSEGIKLIKKAALKEYKKAITFCRLHGISYKKENEKIDEDDSILEDDELNISNSDNEENNFKLIDQNENEEIPNNEENNENENELILRGVESDNESISDLIANWF